MQKQLVRIMNLRYWKSLVVLLLMIVGLFSIAGVRAVNNWQHGYDFNHSQLFTKKYKEHPEYYDLQQSSDDKRTKSLKAYQNEDNQFFKKTGVGGPASNPMMIVVLIVVVYSAGLMTFANDRRTHFDTFLFGLTESRRQIYWTKLLYGIGTLVGSLLVGHAVYYLIVELAVKAPYAQIDLMNLMQLESGNLALMIGIYTIGILIGLVIGELSTLMIGGLGFMWSFVYSITNIGDTWRFLTSDSPMAYSISKNDNGTLLSKFLSLENNHQQLYDNHQQVGLMIGLCLTICLLLWCGAWIYNQLSLENKYQLVQVSSLKKPIAFVSTFYLAWLFGMNGFFSRQPIELIQHHQKAMLGWILLRNLVVIGIFAWLFTERPWQNKKKILFKQAER
ncbi:ABC transporter permease [Latilactobacillus graminis]|uniref:ABC transporter permease n=2 Tax=Latilactobacillus graminis TaxID=60519 RepID=A0AA89I1J5_9LACO|nr:ABC transporter permease [Latilactobacillus graminis]KRM21100.1 hypothetical protein FC90_GL001637 [Latilactobacillus graminis DSM 20719]QFP79227.1 ABC transporter permease [Latilactobacillus graminis]